MVCKHPSALTSARRATAIAALWLFGVGAAALTLVGAQATETRFEPAAQDSREPAAAPAAARPRLDVSGHRQVGKASFYASFFAGRKMADGTPMNPRRDNAASKTLPLGTVAKVTNLETGRSAVVTIQDRGPYRAGRIVDLSPATAQRVGITREQGLALVEVTPIWVPLPGGGVKAGDAAPATRQD